jgi:TP901 family phage tail tape measure protein
VSDALEHEVKIIISVVEDFRGAMRKVDAYNESVGESNRRTVEGAKAGHKMADALENVGAGAKGANRALKETADLLDNIGGRNYRNISTAMDDMFSSQRQAGKDVSNQLRAQMQEREKSFQTQAKQSVQTAQQEKSFLDQIAASHARNAERRRAEEAADRQAQWTSIQNAKLQASEEARVTAELRQQAAQRRNASQASKASVSRTGSFAAGFPQAGLSAADTTWARDAQDRSKRAIAGLRAYDAELNRNTASLKANATTFAIQAQRMDEMASALPRQRYALYDVAFAAGVVTTAITGLGLATVATSASFESAFTNVQRTMEPGTASIETIRGQLMNLTREIPLTFQEVSQIATLGNQLGVEAGAIEGFTGTVARFSAVAGVSAEETAKSFGSMGEILGVLPGQYENLGSSIALVGRRSVATEGEILSLTREIGQQAHSAGLTADQVVGLAGALGELRVPPERARGSLTTYFQTLNKAVADGGDKLDSFAQIVGVTSGELEKMVRGNEGAEILRRFLAALQDFDNVDTTKALDDLGLAQLRVSDVFQRLSSNVDVFNSNLASGSQGWTEGTELARQYGLVLDDLESKWKIFINAVQEASAAVGDALAPAVKAALDAVTPLLHNLTAFAESPVGQWFISVTAAVGGLIAVLAGALGTFALARGALLAIQTALLTTSWASATTGIAGFVSGMLGMSTATGAAATALTVFKWALVATGIGAAIVLLGALTGAFMTAGQAAEQSFQKYIGSTAGLADAVAADTIAYQEAVVLGNQDLADSYARITPAIADNSTVLDENRQQIANTASVLGLTPDAYGTANDAISTNTQYLGDNTIAWAKNQLMQNEAFQKLAGNQQFTDYWTSIGADMDEVIRLSASGGEAAVTDYFYRLELAWEDGQRRLGAKITTTMGAFDSMGGLQSGLAGGGSGLFGSSTGRDLNDVIGLASGLGGQFALLGTAGKSAGAALSAAGEDSNSAWEKVNKTLGGGGGGGGRGGGGGGTAKKIRTLVDYANDLSSVMKRAFDIRFGGQQGLDQITSGWQNVRNAADQAREAVDEHRRSLAQLGADKQVKEYWLSVAENYGDELRAAKLRAELADLAADQAKEQKDLAKAQDQASMTLTGNSEAAIANRAQILGLVGNYQDYLKALAASGMSQKDLQTKSAQLRAEFVQQATSMGFSRGEVDKYAKSFDDMATIIKKIPRNITVTANTNPALQALAEFEAKAKGLAGKRYGGGTISAPRVTTGPNESKAARKALLISEATNLMSGNAMSQIPYPYRKSRLEEIERLLRTGNYWTGGYVGDGGTYEPKGVVHGGEFVFSKAATSFIGKQNLTYMHSMAKAGKSVAPVGLGAAGGMTELSPFDRGLLMEIAQAIRSGLVIDGRTIQSVVNGGNANFAQRRGA